jgi:anti-sigma factor RsiW
MNRRDMEQLSAYLDGELKPSDLTKLETRLKTDPELVSALNDIRAARTLLRKLPQRKAPRNFTLTRKMVGQNPPLPRTYPIFRLATMVATLLFFFSFGINSFGSQIASQQVAIGIVGGGGGSDASESEMFAAEEPAAPPAAAATEEPVMTDEPAAEPDICSSAPATEESSLDSAGLPAEDASRLAETPLSKTAEAAPIVSSTWQIALAVVAVLSALFMGLMRLVSVRRLK